MAKDLTKTLKCAGGDMRELQFVDDVASLAFTKEVWNTHIHTHIRKNK